jgi:phospholipid/cholesterol/gamma-HCH transport system permease protein
MARDRAAIFSSMTMLPLSRATDSYPVVQRGFFVLFRRVSRAFLGTFQQIGARTYFVRDVCRALNEPETYLPQVLPQMRVIGVDSIPITAIVAAFIGAVIALQTRYQLFAGVQLSLVGLATRQTIILELGPLLTGLVLTGRVGARMTAEIGTMRVTEQVDALETLAYDPLAYLIIPRVIATTAMLPILVILADAIGVGSGYVIATIATDITQADFREGLQMAFSNFQVFYSLLKATMFGTAIAIICSYEGYITSSGAEGVGRSTAKAVVIASVAILVLDALTAAVLAPYLQG